MEKLIISKELAEDVRDWKNNVAVGVDELTETHKDELASFMYDYKFDTIHQVAGYLLGGQDKVYEIKKEDPHTVVWGTGLEEFFVVETSFLQPKNRAEVTIRHYDTKEEAEESAKALNDSL